MIEYDGSRYHRDTAHRDRKNSELLSRAGWTVVRIRESPLDCLSTHDVTVDPQKKLRANVLRVLQHLQGLGYCSPVDVEKYSNGSTREGGAKASEEIRDTYLSFEEARDWARNLHLASHTEWRKLVRSNGLPRNIPADPYSKYEAVWTSWSDFLGTENLAPSDYPKRPFEEARAYVRSLGFRTLPQWVTYARSEQRPQDIPSHPDRAYREFVSMPDWLGYEPQRQRFGASNPMPSYEEARDWAQRQGIASRNAWFAFSRIRPSKLPPGIPPTPNQAYGAEFVSWGDFLGTGTPGPLNYRWRSFEEARQFARSLGLSRPVDWARFAMTDARPSDIPKRPEAVYRRKGWSSWENWLTTPSHTG